MYCSVYLGHAVNGSFVRFRYDGDPDQSGNFRPGVYAGCLEIRESKYMRVCIYGGTRWNKPGENIGKY